MDFYQLLTYWGAIQIILCWSHLYFKHNPAFKFVEALGIGLTMGNFVLLTTKSLNNNAIAQIISGQYQLIIPMALGLLVLSQLSKTYMWMARLGVAVILGVGVGTNAYGVVGSDVMAQLRAVVGGYPFYVPGDIVATLSHILVIGLFVGTIGYFVFGREQRGAYGYVTKLGRWGMMICFGVAFGGIMWMREALTETGVVKVLETFGLIPSYV
jgi:branched-subunit amino acid transport protein AzlD